MFEKMKDLYPLKFKPIIKETIWGGSKLRSVLNKNTHFERCGESWEISGVKNNLSVVSEGFLKGNNIEELVEVYMGDLVGDSIYEKFGTSFPLLIKFIDATDVLSIQVHPDDKLAKERHNSSGKTEMWYILEGDPDSELICGFSKRVDKETYLKYLNENKINRILNFEKVQRGDVFFIPAGRVHAIGSGILLAEIQQTSDITYRIFDWNRFDKEGNPRELHTDLALDAIDYKYYDNYKTAYNTSLNKTTNIVDCPYFFTNILKFDKSVTKDYNLLDSFVIYMCIEGQFIIRPDKGAEVEVKKGETILLPAAIKNLMLVPEVYSEVIEVYIK
jgi:mannose-6-phosphate isomerase